VVDIVGIVSENLGKLVPVKIVHSYEQGVKFSDGLDVALLGPGWHWYWPFKQRIEILSVAEDIIDCEVQSLTTKPDANGNAEEVTISFVLTVKVADARKLYVGLQDWAVNIERAARRYIHRRVRSWTYRELIDKQTDLEAGLKETLTKRFEKWGVEISDVGMTDLTSARNYRVYGVGSL
jgi:regulator of protease activity HflC (stomatin/prohibitin superfamily)